MTDDENAKLFNLPDNADVPVPDKVVEELPTEADPKPKKTYKKRVDKIPATDDSALQAEPAEKKPKPKRKLTPEQYERLCNQLKKGRETGLARRKKNAKLKAIDKEEKNKFEDDKIFESLAKKRAPSKLQAENDLLKAEMDEMRENIKKLRQPPAEPKKQNKKVVNEPLEDQAPVVEKKVAFVPPPAKKQLSNRDRLKLLKGEKT